MKYRILDWDSEFFGFKVAQIDVSRLGARELPGILSELQQKNVKLAYWPSDRELDAAVIRQLGGFLADRKTTFAIDLRSLDFKRTISTDTVEPCRHTKRVSDLENLAIQSGELSRFAVDPNVPREKFIGLFKLWINESIRKKIAVEVLCIRDSDRIVGMVTLGEKNGRGDIGLIAVDTEFRGRKYGEMLVRAAQKWFVVHGYDHSQVVTQGRNVAACKLYEHCGYSLEHVAYFYHFWLD